MSAVVVAGATTPQVKPRRFRSLRAASFLNLGALLTLRAAETFIGERHWLATLVTYLPQWPFGLPGVALLAWAALRRSRALGAVNLAALLFATITLLGFRWNGRTAPTDGLPLRVVTLNIHHGSEGVEEIARFIRDARPDIVCLQEANGYRSWLDPAPVLEKRLPGYRTVRHQGLLVASRHPIVASRVLPMLDGPHDRGALEVVIDAGGSRVTLLNVHLRTAADGSLSGRSLRRWPAYLEHTTAVRREQFARIGRWRATVKTPFLVAGDFNTPPRGRFYRRLTGEMEDTFAAVGRGFGYSYPGDAPMLRIDYVFTGNGIRARRATVPPLRLSDHRPLVTELSLSQSSRGSRRPS